MTKTKNFPHRKKARREKAREQVVRRLIDAERNHSTAVQQKARDVDLKPLAFKVSALKSELENLDVNLKEGYTAKQRRKRDRRAAKRRAAA